MWKIGNKIFITSLSHTLVSWHMVPHLLPPMPKWKAMLYFISGISCLFLLSEQQQGHIPKSWTAEVLPPVLEELCQTLSSCKWAVLLELIYHCSCLSLSLKNYWEIPNVNICVLRDISSAARWASTKRTALNKRHSFCIPLPVPSTTCSWRSNNTNQLQEL